MIWKLQIIILRNITVAKEYNKCAEMDFNTEEIFGEGIFE